MITGRNEVVAKVIFLHLSVILFTVGEGVCLSACWDTPQIRHHPLDQTPPPPDQADTTPPQTRHHHPPWTRHHPPDQVDTPPDQTPPTPQTRQTPPNQADTPQHPPDQADPPRSRLQHTVYERPVRILLECILV